MTNSSWESASNEIKYFVNQMLMKTKAILDNHFIGFYIHGSLALGGFNPKNSDIDMIVVTNDSPSSDQKGKLADLFLVYSNNPYPVEVSFLNSRQLSEWQHPSKFDFHYSEYWRPYYLRNQGNEAFPSTDPDLAAHITILNHAGICLEGKPIKEVFPPIPVSNYLSSIMNDFNDCLEQIEYNPIYCTLNLIRVYMYISEGEIVSKLHAGEWGLRNLPNEFIGLIKKVLTGYQSEDKNLYLDKIQLKAFSHYIHQKVMERELSLLKYN
ncbi:streptomycin 3'-adenylyltransferase [Cytobacillus eiseniae]|uniref:Spectinomycin 9-adenylyltransferase n=1 Tax=Cytobacillus eiseniae TaxID=762947 RepID=A0ABS4R9X8_9BACI|nr:aminoglycoside adenylyltransferase domain-containing protein [Cytobacillus eiseniae]MBP2239694.1 streptomycin 3'-adenylyltransferase [Cytobacillus eiseniae]